MKKIEIYIRHNSNGAMLNLHVPSELKEFLLKSLNNGQLDLSNLEANFEISVLPEWIDNPSDSPAHARLKLTSNNINYFEDSEAE